MEKLHVGFALWYLKYKKLLQFVIVIILLGFIGFIMIYDVQLFITYSRMPKAHDPDVLVNLPFDPNFAQPIEVRAVGSFVSQNGYDLVALIHNPNPITGTSFLNYKFILLDAQGQTVKEVGGRAYILPQDSRYIVRTGISVENAQVYNARFEITSVRWIKKAKILEPDFREIENQRQFFVNEAGRTEFVAVIENVGLYSFRNVEVAVVLVNSENTLIGVNNTTLNNFYANTEREVHFYWPGDLKERATQIFIEAKTDVYNSHNFIAPENGDDTPPPSEYIDI